MLLGKLEVAAGLIIRSVLDENDGVGHLLWQDRWGRNGSRLEIRLDFFGLEYTINLKREKSSASSTHLVESASLNNGRGLKVVEKIFFNSYLRMRWSLYVP